MPLSVSIYPPKNPRAAVLIVPAMGVRKVYYSALADWLARRGYLAVTFDYSGMGASRVTPFPEVKVTISDWARWDCATMVDFTADQAPERPLIWLGHSLGGQILGLVPRLQGLHEVITVASGSGYWLESVPSLRWRVWWLWYILAPLALRVFGYFPGQKLRKVGDLPYGVMAQWRRWCLHPEYLFGVENAEVLDRSADLNLPITSFSFTDDELMSRRNIESLHGFYGSDQKRMIRISPSEVGAARIGHFGFFKPGFESTLWSRWLEPELG